MGMPLYEAIFIRRSVKKYAMTPLGNQVLEDIKQYVAATKQLDGQNARFEFVQAAAVRNASVPHYILAYCGENDAAWANVGYVLQKADLYIQSIGLGSWWIGMQKPKEKSDGFCVLLGFGKTDVEPRKGEQDFNRFPVNEISDADNTIAKAARLAPSAANSQPWKLHFENGKVIIKYVGRGMMRIFLKKMNKIDVGIVTRHVETALLHEGKKILSITPKEAEKDLEIEITYGG
jgi:nitroreductase